MQDASGKVCLRIQQNLLDNELPKYLFYTLTTIKQSDIMEVENILKSHFNPEQGEKIMASIHIIGQNKVLNLVI